MKRINYKRLLKGKTLYKNHRKILSDITAHRIPQRDYVLLIGTPQGRNHCDYFVASGTMLEAMGCYEGYAWYTNKGIYQLFNR